MARILECVSRTTIEIDDELLARVMTRYRLRTKREAVDFALRRLVRPPLSREEFRALDGSGWGGDLDALRDNPVREW